MHNHRRTQKEFNSLFKYLTNIYADLLPKKQWQKFESKSCKIEKELRYVLWELLSHKGRISDAEFSRLFESRLTIDEICFLFQYRFTSNVKIFASSYQNPSFAVIDCKTFSHDTLKGTLRDFSKWCKLYYNIVKKYCKGVVNLFPEIDVKQNKIQDKWQFNCHMHIIAEKQNLLDFKTKVKEKEQLFFIKEHKYKNQSNDQALTKAGTYFTKIGITGFRKIEINPKTKHSYITAKSNSFLSDNTNYLREKIKIIDQLNLNKVFKTKTSSKELKKAKFLGKTADKWILQLKQLISDIELAITIYKFNKQCKKEEEIINQLENIENFNTKVDNFIAEQNKTIKLNEFNDLVKKVKQTIKNQLFLIKKSIKIPKTIDLGPKWAISQVAKTTPINNTS